MFYSRFLKGRKEGERNVHLIILTRARESGKLGNEGKNGKIGRKRRQKARENRACSVFGACLHRLRSMLASSTDHACIVHRPCLHRPRAMPASSKNGTKILRKRTDGRLKRESAGKRRLPRGEEAARRMRKRLMKDKTTLSTTC